MGPAGFQARTQNQPQQVVQQGGVDKLDQYMAALNTRLDKLDSMQTTIDAKMSTLGNNLGKQIIDEDQKHTIAIRHFENQFS